MGRRAKKQKVATKARVKVSTKFKCPFCNHQDSVECKMEMSKGKGKLSCRVCGASYVMPIHYLNEPIDIFYEWLDDCEKADKGISTNSGNVMSRPTEGMGGGEGKDNENNTSIGLGEDDSDDDGDDLLGGGLTFKKKDTSGEGDNNDGDDDNFGNDDDNNNGNNNNNDDEDDNDNNTYQDNESLTLDEDSSVRSGNGYDSVQGKGNDESAEANKRTYASLGLDSDSE